ncbi:MAG: hypothetical protein HY316_10190, partial [Acidobacteria bacterium]|nr:hypothetical protein [Acidobacteriota bacterium]
MATHDMGQRGVRSAFRAVPRAVQLLLGCFSILILGAACSTPTPSASPTASLDGREQTTETPSYRIKIRTGPMVTMTMTAMTMTDEGQPVNRHLEVHIFDRNSGAQVKDLIPKVTITDQATGTSRGLPNVTACLESKHLEVEPHFGDNLYLPDGKY